MPSYRRDVGPMDKTFDTTLGGPATNENIGMVPKEVREEAAARTHPGGGAESIDTVFPEVEAALKPPAEEIAKVDRQHTVADPSEGGDPAATTQPKEGQGTPNPDVVPEPAPLSGAPTAPADVNREIEAGDSDAPKEGSGTPNDGLVSANPKQQEAIDRQAEADAAAKESAASEGEPVDATEPEGDESTEGGESEEPSEQEQAEDEHDLPEGTLDTVDSAKKYVDEAEGEERKSRAEAVREAEKDGKDRSTLVSWLDGVIDAEEDSEEE